MNAERIVSVRRLSQQYSYSTIQLHEAVGRKAGLTGTDHKYLGFLIQKGQMTAGELSRMTGLTTGSVTGLIDRLEEKKFVNRRYIQDDRRKVIIEPNTRYIMEIFDPLYKEFRSKTEKLISSFSSQEIKIIEMFLTKATQLADQTTEKLNAV